ncbi:PASTA domain-containing protein [Allokutzneria sp. A3M-2-11 16]|uniref:PASTA domain-containing protein n=1 Tax=Allokutzneria sp. A3M-2-11 16 TaxID=2962043 RepID=UPI0020B80323|nr:PASTA domain-containing protein [Allokutzneria sp. A3M-2-11 16]MCP3799486.1 PASTA domain-containing protein [Allokutzneria sp. A3M-2-11 16]
MIRTTVVVALAVVALSGCKPTSAPPASVAPTTTTATKTAVAAGDVTVPNVVGMEHQKAQDTMQAAGLRNLTEEDATGRKRLLVNDRNWVVVTQEPAAGAVVPKTTKVLLKSKKKDD